ncbi:thioesterase II family protein [Streptomyces globisporus]|uniref:thioesterase II family protein n=1 Tax=Streptomyces globisporus TaxID=1908 RepID=UPI0036F7DDE5
MSAAPDTSAADGARARWFSSRRPRSATGLDLYCFAHAGGSAGEFLRWGPGLPGVRLWAVKLPGRAPREAETPYSRIDELVDDLVAQVDFGQEGSAPREFAFFGHSLGALVAFETARALRRAGLRQPRHLLLSSMQPPPLRLSGRTHLLPDEELLAEVERRWGGLPQVVQDEPELRRIAVRQLRADALLAETHTYVAEDPLDIPVTTFAGDQEDPGQLDWAEHTRRGCTPHVLAGGHFYFRDPGQQDVLLGLMSRAVGRPAPTSV